jgi:hypothetical protein
MCRRMDRHSQEPAASQHQFEDEGKSASTVDDHPPSNAVLNPVLLGASLVPDWP